MNTVLETIEYRGYEIEVHADDDPINPRTEWDNLGTMVCFHDRYNLGDKHSMDIEEAKKIQKSDKYICLPLYLYDHSGITMNTTGFSCPWDSGQVGIIYVSKEAVRKEWEVKRISKNLHARIIKKLRCEVETYDQYITGQVYGYTSEAGSCWGYYGDSGRESMIIEAKDEIDYAIDKEKHKHFKKLKAWIRNKVELTNRSPINTEGSAA